MNQKAKDEQKKVYRDYKKIVNTEGAQDQTDQVHVDEKQQAFYENLFSGKDGEGVEQTQESA